MFEYDRLALDITQQFLTSSSPTTQRFYHQQLNSKNTLSEKSLNGRRSTENDDKQTSASIPRSILHTKQIGTELTGKRSPIAINGLINGYCQYIQQQQNMFSPKSVDSDETVTIFSFLIFL